MLGGASTHHSWLDSSCTPAVCGEKGHECAQDGQSKQEGVKGCGKEVFITIRKAIGTQRPETSNKQKVRDKNAAKDVKRSLQFRDYLRCGAAPSRRLTVELSGAHAAV